MRKNIIHSLIALPLIAGAFVSCGSSEEKNPPGECRVELVFPERLSGLKSGHFCLLDRHYALFDHPLTDTVFTLPADSTKCYAIMWEYPGCRASGDRLFIQFVPEECGVTVNFDDGSVSGGPVNEQLKSFMRSFEKAVEDGDDGYARDICASEFKSHPDNAVGMQALYMCCGTYPAKELKKFIRDANTSRARRKEILNDEIIKSVLSEKH